MGVRVTPACLRAADTAGLMTTSVLLPMTVALRELYVALPEVCLAVADVLEVVPLVTTVPLLEVLLLELLQAATTSPAATIAAMADSREQLRSKPISYLLRLVEANGGHVEVARALRLEIGHGDGALIRLRRRRVHLHELARRRLVRRKRVELARHVALIQIAADDGGRTPEIACAGVGE